MIRHAAVIILCLNCAAIFRCAAQASEGVDNKHVQYWRAHRGELKVEKGAVEIMPDILPQKVQKVLNSNDLYKGWRYSPLYFDKRANLYTLYIKKDSTVTAYGFNDKGDAVTYDSYTVHED